MAFPSDAFVDDIKFVADVTVHSQHEVQTEVDKIANWSFEHDISLSLEKTILLHDGCHQPLHSYAIHGFVIKSVDNFMDLSIACAGYSGHCAAVARKASRVAGAIRRTFYIKPCEIMWPAFYIYILPVLRYASTAWNPVLQSDVDELESIQWRYTKSIRGIGDLTYLERLHELNALTVANQRIFADFVFYL